MSAHVAGHRILARRPIGGGCINTVERVETPAGPFLLKTHPAPPPGFFAAEAAGLAAMAATGAVRVPRVEAVGEDFLLLEWIEPGRPAPGYAATLGRALARMHRAGGVAKFGMEADNYLGTTPQPNGWREDWVAFFREQRLGHQLSLARRNGAGARLLAMGAELMEALDTVLAGGGDPPPALIHGDLWSGNHLADASGQPVLIDPAAYWADREAELGMTRLFGGFPAAFEEAYTAEWPLAPGADRRIAVYTLYHVLNHFNLFGGGYEGQAVGMMGRILAGR